MKKNNIEFSERSRVRLLPEEMDFLKRYVNEVDPDSGFANIRKNTGVSRDTVLRILERGHMEKRTALKLRDFLKALKNSELYKHLK